MRPWQVCLSLKRSTPRAAQRLVLTLGGLGLFFGAALSLTVPVTAQGPVESAQQTIDHARWEQTQTRTAQDNELASQRLTATWLENQQRRAAATWTAQAQQRDTEATQVARTSTAVFVQTQVAAQATVAAQSTQAAQRTQTAQAAGTATAQVVHGQQTSTAVAGTVTMQSLQATATRTALQVQQDAEKRDAALRSLGLGVAVLVAATLMLTLGVLAVRWLILRLGVWPISVPRRAASVPPVVQTPVIELNAKPVNADPNRSDVRESVVFEATPSAENAPSGVPPAVTQIPFSPDGSTDAQTAQVALDMITRKIEKMEANHVSANPDEAAHRGPADLFATE